MVSYDFALTGSVLLQVIYNVCKHSLSSCRDGRKCAVGHLFSLPPTTQLPPDFTSGQNVAFTLLVLLFHLLLYDHPMFPCCGPTCHVKNCLCGKSGSTGESSLRTSSPAGPRHMLTHSALSLEDNLFLWHCRSFYPTGNMLIPTQYEQERYIGSVAIFLKIYFCHIGPYAIRQAFSHTLKNTTCWLTCFWMPLMSCVSARAHGQMSSGRIHGSKKCTIQILFSSSTLWCCGSLALPSAMARHRRVGGRQRGRTQI